MIQFLELKMKNMKFRDDYLCTQCQMYHPRELDKFLKNQIKALVRDYPESYERLKEQVTLWVRVSIADKKSRIETFTKIQTCTNLARCFKF